MAAALDDLVSDEVRAQLDRLEQQGEDIKARLREANRRLAEINGTVQRHDHDLYGSFRRGGGVMDQLKGVIDRIGEAPRPGYIPIKAAAAIGAVVVGVFAAVITFLVGML